MCTQDIIKNDPKVTDWVSNIPVYDLNLLPIDSVAKRGCSSPSEFVKKKRLNLSRNIQNLAKIAQFVCSRVPLQIEQISASIGLDGFDVMLIIGWPCRRLTRKASRRYSEFRAMVMADLPEIDENSVVMSYVLEGSKPKQVDDDRSLRVMLEDFDKLNLEQRELCVTVNQTDVNATIYDLQHPYSSKDTANKFNVAMTVSSSTTDAHVRSHLETKMAVEQGSEIRFSCEHGTFVSIKDFYRHVQTSEHGGPVSSTPQAIATAEVPARGPKAKITLDIEVRKPDPPELSRMSPELQQHLKSKNLVALAPALAQDGIERPCQLAGRHMKNGVPDLPAVDKALQDSGNKSALLGSLQELKLQVEQEQDAKLHEKATAKQQEASAESSKKFEEMKKNCKEIVKAAETQAKANRNNEAKIVRETASALIKEMQSLNLPKLDDFQNARDVKSLESMLMMKSDLSHVPKNRSTAELVSLANMQNGVYLDPLKLETSMWKSTKVVRWASGTTPDDLASCFRYTSLYAKCYTSEIMTEQQFKKAWSHRERHGADFGFHAGFQAAANLGCFAMGANISAAKEDIEENERASGKKETTWCMMSHSELPQLRTQGTRVHDK